MGAQKSNFHRNLSHNALSEQYKTFKLPAEQITFFLEDLMLADFSLSMKQL